uniref:Aminopeptidase n=1 Tax=Gadus morhua TaxID=8049 RepID=A0A8C5CRI8_GADMO
MAKGFYLSRNLAMAGLLLAAIALVTIIALSVVYDKERSRNRAPSNGAPSVGASSPSSSSSIDPYSSSTSASPGPQKPWQRYRLPDTLAPVHYDITLWPRLEPDQQGLYIFTGNSTVRFVCLKDTDLIIIHANKLNFTLFQGHEARLKALDPAHPVPQVQSSWLQEETEYLVLQLDGALKAGRVYLLETQFKGELADDLEGFYRSQYTEDGVQKVLATSQMQATFARKAFPCFDEPAMKATFSVVLIHPQGTGALSNSKQMESSRVEFDGIPVSRTTFEPTKRMSTYLLAFIVSGFSFIEGDQETDVQVRIWARHQAITEGQGDYALNVTEAILNFYEHYYNTSYPLSKSDQVALPDFNAGAMENWGLITYRETALLYDPVASSTGNKERVLTVIAHELAHMWFGNLVTLRWWNDLWLNEGFASYVEYLGADHAEPTWDIKEHIIFEVRKVFAVDALASSHPLSRREEEVNRPSEITEMFNTISYSKGAAVLRMLSEFLSEPVFAKGLSSYLNMFAFNNTVYTDLWDHLQLVSDTPSISLPHSVQDIMNRWVLQMGFPVVTVDTRTGQVSQQHFLNDPQAVVERGSPFNYTWFVPIKWIKSGVEQEQFWLLKKTGIDSRVIATGDQWVLANTNVSGYFRVNYDLENWERLLHLLHTDHQAIPTVNRAQLLDDAFNLARAKVINTTLALRTTSYLSKERDYIPWASALSNLNYYFLMFDRTEVYGPLQGYIRKQTLPLFEYYRTITANWARVPPGHNDQYNQINALNMACNTGLKDCKELALRWFSEWMADPERNPIHPNLKSTVYCSAIAFGGTEEWDFAWRMFQNATVATESARLRSALACTKAPWLLNRYLQYSIDPTKIRKQDSVSTIVAVARNVVGMPLAWNFVRENWSYIFNNYGRGSFSFSGLITGITQRFSTEFELKELERFKEQNLQVGFGSASLALEQAIENTRANIRWLAESRSQVLDWLSGEAK